MEENHFATDDVINFILGTDQCSSNAAECSVASDTVDTSICSVLADQFVSEANNIPRRLYCPFCLLDFGFDFLLKSHIRADHAIEMRKFSNVDLATFVADPCAYCHAKFYARELLPKHILRKHQECVLGLVSKIDSGRLSCAFCPYSIAANRMKLLFIHVENKHLDAFVALLTAYRLRDESAKKAAMKPILKRGSLYGTTDDVVRTRRKLRFDLPDLSTSTDSDKENEVGTPKMSQTRPALRDITPVLSALQVREEGVDTLECGPFKCGVCDESFEDNVALRVHVKGSHRRRLIHLQQRYKCGLCKAKFFKNSYLVKHNKYHHN